MTTPYHYNRRPRHNRNSWRICNRVLYERARRKWVEMNPTLVKLFGPVVKLRIAMAKLYHALEAF